MSKRWETRSLDDTDSGYLVQMKSIIDITVSGPGMVTLQFDDGTMLPVDRNIVSKYKLKASQVIDDITLDKLLDETDGGKCYEAALHYLEFRSRSENELKRHLLSKHIYSTTAIERTVERLKQSKLLNDRSFAEAWVNDRIKYKPKSRLMIQKELMQKGVSPEDIMVATGEVDDISSAYQAGRKKAVLLRSRDKLEFSRRLSAYLLRRGYSNEVTRSVVTRLWQEIEEY
jgi:regulatory protein